MLWLLQCLDGESSIEELLERKRSGSDLENREYGRRNPSLWPLTQTWGRKWCREGSAASENASYDTTGRVQPPERLGPHGPACTGTVIQQRTQKRGMRSGSRKGEGWTTRGRERAFQDTANGAALKGQVKPLPRLLNIERNFWRGQSSELRWTNADRKRHWVRGAGSRPPF
jgi:hypothetical protein